MMDTENLIHKIEEIIKPVIESEGLELFDLKLLEGGNQSFLRIFIDKDGGVTLDDCQNVSTQVGAILDVEDIIDCHYILEVSSPGLERPLKKEEDFVKYTGETIRLSLFSPLNDKKKFTGKIIDFKSNTLTLELKKDGKINIPYDMIKNAKLEIEL
jgi:ribosome maturation factor RimP